MIDSRYIDFARWAGQTTQLIAQYGSVPVVSDESEWRDWAQTVVSFPAIASVGAPRPEKFDDWRPWSHQFNAVVRLLGN